MNSGLQVATRKALLEAARLPKAKRATARLQVRKDVYGRMQPVGDRQFRFTISTSGIDRSSDRVIQSGWDLTAYKANPIVLWDHGMHPVLGCVPIGRSTYIGLEGGALKAVVALDPANTPISGPFAEMIKQKLQAGSLFACSVGFRPIDFDFARDRDDDEGFDFKRQELTEWSIVSVPCNPDTLIETSPGSESDTVLDLVSGSASRGFTTRPGTAARRVEVAALLERRFGG